MPRLLPLVAATFGLLLPGITAVSQAGAAEPEPLTVVASIKPIHSLVSAVMAGVSHRPHLLVSGAGSPHSYALKPSDAAALSDAKVVFWVGPDLETFLDSTIDGLPENTRVVTLETAPGVTRLPMREGGVWEAHMHGDNDHDEHDQEDHDHEGHADHDHGEHEHEAHAGHDHDDHGHEAHADHDPEGHEHDHHHGGMDPHVWLDPVNAKAMVDAIVHALSDADPANAEAYAQHGAAVEERLDHLTAAMRQELAPVTDAPFIVFHDGYQYLEARFGLHAVGSITINPEVSPGAARLSEIRAKVKDSGATCIFREPQFSPRLAQVAMEGLNAHVGILDPLGADLEPGAALYETMMRKNAEEIATCLRQGN